MDKKKEKAILTNDVVLDSYEISTDKVYKENTVSPMVDQKVLDRAQISYSAIIESTNDMIWSVDAEKFGLLSYNHSLRDYFSKLGYQLYIGMRPEDMNPTIEFRDTWHALYKRALFEGSYSVEYAGIAGKAHMLLTFGVLKHENEIFGISVFGKDITDRKHAEQDLKQLEEKFQTLYMSIPIPSYIWQQTGSDLILANYNEAADVLTHGAIKHLIGTKLSEMYRDNPRIQSDVKRCLRKKTVIEQDMEYYLKSSGELKFLHVKYTFVPPNYVMVLTEDITERKQSEDELFKYKTHLEEMVRQRTRELEMLNQLVFVSLEAADVGAWWVDFTEDDIYHALETTAKMIGIPLSKFPDQRYYIREWENILLETKNSYPDKYGKSIDNALEQFYGTISGKYKKYQVIYPILMQDKTIKWFDVRADVSSRDEDGKAKFMTGTLIDVTKLMDTENELTEHKINLEQIVLQRTQELDQRNNELKTLSERLVLAARAAKIGVWDWDIVKDELVWDDGMYNLYNITRENFSGAYEAWTSHVYPEDREKTEKAIQQALSGEKEYSPEFRIKWDDGTIHYIRASAMTFCDLNGKPSRMVGINWDTTDLVLYEQKLRENAVRYKSLIESTNDWIWVVEPQNFELVFFNTAVSEYFNENFGKILINGLPPEDMLPLDEAILFRGFYSKVITEGSFKIDYHTSKGDIYLSIFMSRMLVDDHIIGISIFGQDVTNEEAYKEELIESNNTLSLMFQQSINTISKIGELRDVYTAGHQKRVSELSCAIAREMNLKEDVINNISWGAMIHDIGKIYIASDILNKPGKISDLEYLILQTHAEHSYEVIKEIDFPWQIKTMVLQHHERLDGTGYPQKLQGNQIILESRILAVADVVEAMTSHRPYRPALGIEVALEEIERYRDIRYDSEVVDICIKLFREKNFAFSVD